MELTRDIERERSYDPHVTWGAVFRAIYEDARGFRNTVLESHWWHIDTMNWDARGYLQYVVGLCNQLIAEEEGDNETLQQP